jgi:phosphoribosylformylglycinamidine (FGAM) synthase PurS component
MYHFIVRQIARKNFECVTMKWGKIYELDVSEDSKAVAKAMVNQAASGISEALAQKIEN